MLEVDDLALRIGEFDADRGFSRDRRFDTDRLPPTAMEISLWRLTTLLIYARRKHYFVARDHGSGADRHYLAFHAEICERLFEDHRIFLDRLFVDHAGERRRVRKDRGVRDSRRERPAPPARRQPLRPPPLPRQPQQRLRVSPRFFSLRWSSFDTRFASISAPRFRPPRSPRS